MGDEQRADDVLPTLISVAIFFIVLDTVVISLRFISRTLIQKAPIGLDDVLVLPSYAMNIGLCAIAIIMAKLEMKTNPPAHEALSDPAIFYSVIEPGAKCIYALLPLLYMGACFPKLSLLAMYLRIFVNRGVRIATFITMGFVIVAGLVFTLGGFFACQPVSYFWNKLLPNGHCLDLNKYYHINTPFNILIDIAIFIIPLPALWKLQAPRPKRLAYAFVFSIGGLGVLATVGRWVALLKYRADVLIPYNTTVIVSWCIVEPAMYLIAACLPPCSSIVMLAVRNERLRWMFNLTKFTKHTSGHGGSPAVRSSGFRRSFKNPAGFAQIEDEERLRKYSMPTSPTAKRGGVSVTNTGVSAEREDVSLNDLSGIGIRTDITITHSSHARDRKDAQNDLSLPEMLHSESV